MKLKDFMSKHKITVVEMARWIGVSGPTIQAWKYGKTKISVDSAILIMALSGGEIQLIDLVQHQDGEESGGWIPPIDYLEKHRPDLLTELDKETKPTIKARNDSKEQLISPAKFTKAQA